MALDVHFVNVGKGSCTIINPPSGRLTVIDIDDSRAVSDIEKAFITLLKDYSLTNPSDYLDQYFPERDIFRFILTHPDMDHMSGIKNLFESRNIWNFWDTNNTKESTSWEGSPYDPEDWKFYQKLRKGEINGTKIFNNHRSASNRYWVDDSIEILNPHPDLLSIAQDSNEYDHISQVIKISHAEKSLLLCGDTTKEAFEHVGNDTQVDLSAHVMLAPGHGSKNHVHEDVIKRIGHTLTIVSVAEGVDFDYDFYSKFGPVLSTKNYGNIRLRIEDNGEIVFRTQVEKYANGWNILS